MRYLTTGLKIHVVSKSLLTASVHDKSFRYWKSFYLIRSKASTESSSIPKLKLIFGCRLSYSKINEAMLDSISTRSTSAITNLKLRPHSQIHRCNVAWPTNESEILFHFEFFCFLFWQFWARGSGIQAYSQACYWF